MLQLLVACFGGIPVGLFIAYWYGEEIEISNRNSKIENGDDHLKPFKVTIVIMVFLEGCVLCLCMGLAIVSGLKNIPSICCVVVPCFNLGVIIVTLIVLKSKGKDDELFFYIYILPLSVAVCYHFLWVLLGLFANPSWAFPVLLSICSLVLLFYILAYYLRKVGFLIAYALFLYIVIMFLLFMAFTWMSVKFFLANHLISSFIHTLLTSIMGLLFSLISYFKPFSVDKKSEGASKANKEVQTELLELIQS